MKLSFISYFFMNFKKFVKDVQKIQIHLKPLDIFIYSYEIGDFDKLGIVFLKYNICICGIYICKSHFPITCVKRK